MKKRLLSMLLALCLILGLLPAMSITALAASSSNPTVSLYYGDGYGNEYLYNTWSGEGNNISNAMDVINRNSQWGQYWRMHFSYSGTSYADLGKDMSGLNDAWIELRPARLVLTTDYYVEAWSGRGDRSNVEVRANSSLTIGPNVYLRSNAQSGAYIHTSSSYVVDRGDSRNVFKGQTGNINVLRTLTLNGNGGSNATKSVYMYDYLPLVGYATVSTRTGYTFLGWYDGSGYQWFDGNGAPVSKRLVTGSTTLYARWRINQYTATFDKQNGTGGSNSATITYGSSSVSSLTPPTRVGYTFDGYYTAANGSGTQYFDANMHMLKAWDIASSQTLYAKWTANQYQVTLNANRGQGGTTVDATYDSAMPSGVTPPTRPGYTFAGYYDDAAGTGTKYYDDQMASAQTYQTAGPLTLYAQWAPLHYSINLNSNNTYIKTISDVTYGELYLPTQKDLADEGIDIAREHYIFQGWNLYDGQNWAMYQAGQTYHVGLTTAAGQTVVVYAAWQILDNYTFTYDLNGGTGTFPIGNVFKGDNYAINLTEPTRANYTFLGWSTDANAAEPTYSTAKGMTINDVQHSYTLYAIWKLNPSLSYNANGGSFAAQQDKQFPAEGDTVDVQFENTPTCTGYVFTGWNTKMDGSGASYKSGETTEFTMGSEDMILYAQWAPAKLTISYPTAAQGEYRFDPAPADTDYGTDYSFTLKLPAYIDCTGLWVAINGVQQVTPAAATDASGKSFTYNVVAPTVAQTITVGGYTMQTYSVALNTDGGTVTEDNVTSYIYGGGATLPTNVTRAGYTFGGWHAENDPGQVSVTEITATDFGDKSYVAKWTANTYTIKFIANGGSGTMSDQENVTYDNTVALADNTFTYGSHAFLGWSTSVDAVFPEYTDQQSVKNLATEGAVTLYAVWNLPSFTVTYSANGGTWNAAAPGSGRYKTGAEVEIQFDNLPTRTNYTFDGWTDGTTDYAKPSEGDSAPTLTNLSANVVLTANWKGEGHTVRFDANTGTGDMDAQTFTYGEDAQALTANGFTAPDTKCFLGWSTTADALAPSYLDGQKLRNLTEDITLYAVWGNAQIYYVSYDANGGTWKSGTVPSAETGSVTVANGSTLLTRTGYTCTAWEKGDSTEVRFDATIDTISETSNTILYAKWEPITYTVSFESTTPALSSSTTQTLTFDKAEALTAATTDDASYKFLGWSTSDASDSVVYQDGQTVLNLTNKAETITLYAVWEPETAFPLVYNANGGTGAPSSVSVAKDDTVTLDFTPPSRTGYTFLGWNAAPNDINPTYTAAGMSTLTMTTSVVLYAIWLKNPTYTVSYFANDGSGIVPRDTNEYLKGQKAPVVYQPAPVKVGYQFTGWTDGTNTYVNGTNNETAAITADVNLVPMWESNTYTVYFHNGNDDVNTNKQEFTYGTAQALNCSATFINPGHTLAGWSTMPDSGAAYTVTQSVKNLSAQQNGEVHLYAAWTAGSAELTLDHGGGIGQTGKLTATYGQPMPTITVSPTREGYTFGGYFTGEDGGGTQYYSAELNGLFYSDFSAATTLYAKWTPRKYTVVYYQDGAALPHTQTLNYDQSDVRIYSGTGAGADVPTGFSLVGWDTNPLAQTVVYTPEQSVEKNALWNNGGTVQLYAVIRNDTKVTLSFDANGGTGRPASASYSINQLVTLDFTNSPTRNGYTFLGWSTDPNAAAADYSPAGLTQFPIQEQTVLNAVWGTNQYTIRYEGNGGKWKTGDSAFYSVPQDCWTEEFSLSRGAGLERENYELVGWSSSQNGALTYDLGQTLYTDLATKNGVTVPLYAVWKAVGYQTGITSYSGAYDGLAHNLVATLTAGDMLESTRSYQWYWNGSAIEGASKQIYPVKNVADSGEYTCKISGVDSQGVQQQTTTQAATVSITRAPVTLEAAATLVYGNSFQSANLRFAGLQNGETDSVISGKELVNVTTDYARYGNVGSYPLTVEGADKLSSPNYSISLSGASLLTVSPRPVTITWDYVRRVHTGSPLTITPTAGNLVNGDTLTLTVQGNTETDEGDYTAQVTGLSSSNYTLSGVATATQTWKIIPAGGTEIPGGGGGSGTGGGGGGISPAYTVTVNPATGGAAVSSVATAAAGKSVTITIHPDDGYSLKELVVADADGKSVRGTKNSDGSYTFEMPAANVTVTASFVKTPLNPSDTGVADLLQTDDHIRYISGYSDVTVGPERNMTRGEVAQMFYNLLLNKDVTITKSFPDVPETLWCSKAVGTLASLGIIAGYSNGEFGWSDSITREQFCAIAVRFATKMKAGSMDYTVSFPDVTAGSWSYDSVMTAASLGWINGYSTGKFGPKDTITRAQVMTIVNHMLGRSADKDFVDSASGIKTFTDLAKSHWAYYDIMEATNAHDHTADTSGDETWTGLK